MSHADGRAKIFQKEEIARGESASCGQGMTSKPVCSEQQQPLKNMAKRLLETNLTQPLAIVRTTMFARSEIGGHGEFLGKMTKLTCISLENSSHCVESRKAQQPEQGWMRQTCKHPSVRWWFLQRVLAVDTVWSDQVLMLKVLNSIFFCTKIITHFYLFIYSHYLLFIYLNIKNLGLNNEYWKIKMHQLSWDCTSQTNFLWCYGLSQIFWKTFPSATLIFFPPLT